nr:coiled-coil domain-containing protein 142 isoform X4 [Oryctolagus cuniculus]
MAQASRSSGPLPPLTTASPLWAQPGGAGEEPWEGRRAAALRQEVRGCPGLPVAGSIPCLDPRPGGALWRPTPKDAGEDHEAGSADWRREPAAGGPMPPALQRLRAVLLRLHREREQLLQARDCARHLQAAVRLLRTLCACSPSLGSGAWSQLCRDLRLHTPRGVHQRIGLRETPEPLLLARPIGLAAQRLDAAIEMQLRALGRAPASPASLPQECEKELASLCHSLHHQSLVWSWDQGFCQALGSAVRDQNSLPASSHTMQLLQQLFPPLLDALREPGSGLLFCRPPGPAPTALGLCTLQTTLLWFLGRTQRHLAAWAPRSFLLLIQKDLPPLLREAEALSRLASEESSALEVEQQLSVEIQMLAAQIQLLPEESLDLFFQECHKQATQGFELHMPRGRYWRLRLSSELPSVPSEYAGFVIRTVLEPVLQGLQGLPPQAQAPVLGPTLTAILRAWLDHILTHGIRFSLQGALQLRQDFGVVRELLEEEQWGLSPELRQSLFTLSIFQQLDGALLCLLQQPPPKTRVHRRSPCCCARNDVQTTELPSSSLNSLESLEPPLRSGALPAQTPQLLSTLWGGGPSPEAYLVGNQQAWLALRQHQHSRWHLPFLSCLGISPES